MWLLILVFILSILILAIVEEMKEFFVNRYVLGPAAWEDRLKEFLQKQMSWAKTKLRKEPSNE